MFSSHVDNEINNSYEQVVVNDDNEVVGVVTRKDLARFRVKHQAGHMERETVHITEQVQ